MVLPRRRDLLTLADSQVPELDMAASRLENPATVHAVWTPRQCGPREAAKAAPAESCSDRSLRGEKGEESGDALLPNFQVDMVAVRLTICKARCGRKDGERKAGRRAVDELERPRAPVP